MTIKTLIKNLDKKEWLFLIFMAVLVILATTLPYAYGYLKAPENTYFLAVSGLNKVDYPNYFSYIEQVKQGHFLFEDYYTTEPQPRIIFNLFFLVLGFIAKIFHSSAAAVFHIARIVLIPVFIFIFYLFASFLFKEKIKRKIALILVCFSSGIGGLSLFLSKISSIKNLPIDLWVPEAFTFLSLYINPLYIASFILISGLFLFVLLAQQNNKYKYSFVAGLCGLLLFQIRPYVIPTIFLVLFSFWVYLSWTKRKIDWFSFKRFFIFFLISSPSIFYYFWLFTQHSLTIHRIAQAQPSGFSSNPLVLLIGYGLLIPLSILGIKFFIKKSPLLIIWGLTHILLIYSLFIPLQKRTIEGFHLVISIFAAQGLFIFLKRIKENFPHQNFILKNKFLWIVLFIFLFAYSNIFVVSKDLLFFSHPAVSLPQEIVDSMTWLKKNSSENSAVLSSSDLEINNLIPALAVRKVYIGHWCETAYSAKKIKEVDWFFQTNDHDWEKHNFLREKNLNYVLIYKKSRVFQPENKEYLKKVFENDLIGIYQVLL